ncbi:hypothetical protein Kpho02_37050 [Kitasatospora phosalacinea]|uniref:SnoaL-like domain-containing protein n=1 Tax=Kitasatospora phosalacinea TaxID=2065 RepID=A0A9W6QAF3_9ACTN|nr:nuclear transport factor 2 family protein [Kitasatospora phosalacinea]GLW71406.1 hypothetical protein Kpho02_37050 [Kitasatospora phosalacinea]
MTPRLSRRTALLTGAAAALPAALAAAPAPAAAACLTVEQAARWTDAYLAAWRSKDAAAAARLFTPDARYEAVPGVADQTYVGRDAIRGYWSGVTAGQSEITTLRGTPLVTGDRACVELWVTLRAAGANPSGDDWITLIETNVLTFTPDLLCRHNVEYWNLQPGRLAPPAGWGTAR